MGWSFYPQVNNLCRQTAPSKNVQSISGVPQGINTQQEVFCFSFKSLLAKIWCPHFQSHTLLCSVLKWNLTCRKGCVGTLLQGGNLGNAAIVRSGNINRMTKCSKLFKNSHFIHKESENSYFGIVLKSLQATLNPLLILILLYRYQCKRGLSYFVHSNA